MREHRIAEISRTRSIEEVPRRISIVDISYNGDPPRPPYWDVVIGGPWREPAD